MNQKNWIKILLLQQVVWLKKYNVNSIFHFTVLLNIWYTAFLPRIQYFRISMLFRNSYQVSNKIAPLLIHFEKYYETAYEKYYGMVKVKTNVRWYSWGYKKIHAFLFMDFGLSFLILDILTSSMFLRLFFICFISFLFVNLLYYFLWRVPCPSSS